MCVKAAALAVYVVAACVNVVSSLFFFLYYASVHNAL